MADYYSMVPGEQRNLKVLDNDLPPVGGELDEATLEILVFPEHDVDAEFRVHNDHVHYEAGPSYVGPDSFTYRICDVGGLCGETTVNISISATEVGDDCGAAQAGVALLPNAELFNCDLSGVTIAGGTDLTDSDLSEANLDGAILENVNLTDATVKDATLMGADLGQAIIDGLDLDGADLTDADFTDATGEPKRSDDATYSATTCPDGTVSNGPSCWR